MLLNMVLIIVGLRTFSFRAGLDGGSNVNVTGGTSACCVVGLGIAVELWMVACHCNNLEIMSLRGTQQH